MDKLNKIDMTEVSIYEASQLLFKAGKGPHEVVAILKTLKQPSEGYYYSQDVIENTTQFLS